MSNAFDGLTDSLVWKSFKSITEIPRPSKHEEKIIQFMLGWAKENGFEVLQDDIQNVVIRIPATPGKENATTVVLQGHLDMVAEKNNDVEFDFLTQGLNIIRDGDFLTADGTTLGADNGIGVAMAMAVALDKQAIHGPIELLFTVDEETGLTGAFELSREILKGTMLLNIDSEEEGFIFVGCAGGTDTTTSLPVAPMELPKDAEVVDVTLKGLIGGHSGITIHENRANALKTLATLFHEVIKEHHLHICEFSGGDKHNAIPRESHAVVAGKPGIRAIIEEKALTVLEGFKMEFGKLEPNGKFYFEQAQAARGLSEADSKNFLHLLLSLPHGVETMSRDIEGMVETSSNLARINWLEDKIEFLNSTRSSVASALDRVLNRIHAVAEMAGAQAVHGNGYPGWQPNMDSKLLKVAREVHKEVLGKDAVITAIHAGLECGIIGEKYPGMEMISIGPDMFDVHSPDERLNIPFTDRVYGYLKALLERIAQ